MTDHRFAAWVEVDLAALCENLEQLSKLARGRVAAVVKADGYGHGAVRAAEVLVDQGVELLVVARPREAVQLRQAGIQQRLLLLAPPDDGSWPVVQEHRLEVACSTPESLDFLVQASAEVEVPVHVKVNTGMNRLGLPPESVPEALNRLAEAPAVRPVALCSHLADADLLESERTKQQTQRFDRVLAALPERFADLETHLSNSAGVLHHRLPRHTFVRLGQALYGYDPVGKRDLEPVMSVHARVLQVHRLEPGERVGYGGHWQAREPVQVGVVGVGYGDGYAFHQSGSPILLTDNGPRPIVGSLSMDMLTFAVPMGEPLAVGDEVTLLGSRGGRQISAHDLAATAETLPYEVLVRFGGRLPRVYRPSGSG